MIDFNISCNTVEEAIAEMKVLSAALGGGLPPMQEQPNRDPAPAQTEPPKKTRKPKEEAKADAGELKPDAAAEAPTDSSQTSTDAASSTSIASIATEVPDIELVRAKLKQLGATDGLGHDKVFEVLGKYKATNASSVPTEKRADLIAEIDVLLAGVK